MRGNEGARFQKTGRTLNLFPADGNGPQYLPGAIFDPQLICSTCSQHNWQILDQVPTYSNGRLVKNTRETAATVSTTYYTYSDGTTGRE